GWLTDNFNWRWVFFVNLPLGVICVAILWWLLPSRPVRKRPFDLFGFVMLAIGISALQLMLDRGQGEDWLGSIEIWIEMLVAVIALWIFVVHMATAKNPMFERALWLNRNLVTAMFFMLVIGVVMMATMALLPPMLQNLYGHSVFDTGILLMPRGFGVILTMAISARLIQRGLDARIVVGLGMVLAAYSLWQMTHWSLEMGTWPIIVSGFVQGLGMGLVFMPLNGMAFATLAPHHRTEGASLINLARNIGASVGISLVTTILARSVQQSHEALVPNISPENLNTMDPGLLQTLGGSGETLLAMANAEINRQAMMIGYLNDFYAMMIVTALSVPLVIFLRKPKGPAEKPDASAMGH
ncbi:MAG: MFS transporter, partial [Sphingomonadales bacterium]